VKVSVIVPVRDRRDLLTRCLDALAAQTHPDVEVVVVDDGSTDGSAERAEEMGLGPVVRLPAPRGAVAARTAGAGTATGEVLAFTDSDCRPAPDWVEAGVRHIAAGADVVQGRTVPDGTPGLLDRTVSVGGDDGLFPTCNVFYRREAFDRAGGFDLGAADRLGFRVGARARGLGMGEDTLLGWRVRRAGRAVFAADTVVRHAVLPPDLADSLGRAVLAGGFPALVREVPELRGRLLTRGVLLGTTHPPLYATAVLSALALPEAAAFCLGLWVGAVWRRAGREPDRGRRLRALPVLLALDAVEGAALVAGSIRSRTVVL
jgi:glycosyl transferase family 2